MSRRFVYADNRPQCDDAIDVLRAALAQQEDVGLLEYRGNSVAFIHQKMTAYRAGIDAAWDAFRANGMHPDGKTSLADMIAKHTAPPQQPSPEPVARECSDPMCACRGGPCAECEEGQREKEIEDLRCSLDFYQRRCEALQSWQSKMRDPERTIVCDILANGFTLDPAFAGNRYTAPPQRTPLSDETIDALWRAPMSADWEHREFARAIERAHGIIESEIKEDK